MWVVDREGGYVQVSGEPSQVDGTDCEHGRVRVSSYVREDLDRVVKRSGESATVEALEYGVLGWATTLSAEGYLRSLSAAVDSMFEPRNWSLPRYPDSESVSSKVRERALERATDGLVMLRYGDVPPTSMTEILSVRGDLDVIDTTAGAVSNDPSLVEPGDLIEFTFVQTGGETVHRSLVKVAQVRRGSYLDIAGHWSTRHFNNDGTDRSLSIGYTSFSAVSWDPIRILKGGAPEIFDGEGMARLGATIAAFESGDADFEDLSNAVEQAVFSVGMRAPKSDIEVYEFADNEPYHRATFDRVIGLLRFRKLITSDQRRRLLSVARFTNGNRGRPYEPDLPDSSEQPQREEQR